MINITITKDGREIDVDDLEDELRAEMIDATTQRLLREARSRLSGFHCPDHNAPITLELTLEQIGDTRAEGDLVVSTCCDNVDLAHVKRLIEPMALR